MRVASLADLHFRGKDLPAAVNQLAAALAECRERDVDLILVAGDLFDKANVSDAHASTGAIAGALGDVLGEHIITHMGADIVAIPGNHDKAGAGSVDATRVLDPFPGLLIVREPGWSTRFGPSGAPSVFCLPWVYGADPAALLPSPEEILARKGPRILLAHVQVIGGKMSGFVTCDKGSFAIGREVLDALPFDRFALGDFHSRQDLFGGRGGYVGALRQLDHAEAGNPAGFEIWEPRRVGIDPAEGSVEWIELDEAPRYRTVTLAPGSPIPQAGPGEVLRVRCDGWEPTRADASLAESGGRVTIEAIMEAPERVGRGVELPPGGIDRPEDLLAVWAAAQVPPVGVETLAGLTAALRGLLADPTVNVNAGASAGSNSNGEEAVA